jgi:hypothetical protein
LFKKPFGQINILGISQSLSDFLWVLGVDFVRPAIVEGYLEYASGFVMRLYIIDMELFKILRAACLGDGNFGLTRRHYQSALLLLVQVPTLDVDILNDGFLFRH